MRFGHISAATLILLAVLIGTVSLAETRHSQPNQAFTSTIILGSSVSTSLSETRQIYNGPFTVLSTTGTSLSCEFVSKNFTAVTGQYVFGNMTSTNPIAVYVVEQSIYANWVKMSSCGNTGQALAGTPVVTTSYSFNGTIPSSGTWTIVLVNSSNAKNADGFLSAYVSAGSSTTAQLIMSTFTSTLPQVVSTSASSPSTGVPGFPIASIVLGLVVGLAAVGLLRRQTRSNSSRPLTRN